MAQIFISHSAKDKKSVSFFSKIFSGTKVKAIFEEFEKLSPKTINSRQIQNDIKASNCIFILLDENVENMKHTRDWVAWECGYGSTNNRDVWVFEKQSDFGKISIITPSLKHYVWYDYSDDTFAYIKAIILSYDNSNVINTTIATTTLGGLIADEDDKLAGIAIGLLAGVVFGKKNPQPNGIDIKCLNCKSIYKIHIPPNQPTLRCPVCNKILRLSKIP